MQLSAKAPAIHKRRRVDGFTVFNVCLMLLIVFLTAYPFWFAAVGAFNSGTDYMRGGVYFWPRKFTTENIKGIFSNPAVTDAFKITILKCLIGTATSLIFTSLAAYAITRPALKGRNIYLVLIMFTRYFSGGLIPYFILINGIGLYNSFWVYIIPGLFSVWNMIIIQSFMRELPIALYESAKIDGASEYCIFFKIILPLSKPVLAAIALFTLVHHWNAYFDSLMYTSSAELQTIQLFLKKLITDSWYSAGATNQAAMALADADRQTTPQSLKLAAMVVTAAPILVSYPFLQKYFIKGMTIGAVKG